MKRPASDQKLRGGYYTPVPVARFLTSWAVRSSGERVLEPSSGGGVFLDAAVRRLQSLGADASTADVTGVELDASAADESRAALAPYGKADAVVEGDFFGFAERALALGHTYDVVLGNPPFLRFQHFKPDHQETAFRLMRRHELSPNRLTNAWVPFVVGSASLLSQGGRLAMVVPAELLQVSYAAGLRQFLSEFFDRITVVTFDRLVFEGIQQEVVLLCAERRAVRGHGIRILELRDQHDLENLPREFGETPLQELDHTSEKWTQYFLPPEEMAVFRSLRADAGFVEFGDVASADVGVVTGMNDFFVVSESESRERGLDAFVTPIVTRSNQLVGACVGEEDWERLRSTDKARYLLRLTDETPLTESVADYLRHGEAAGVHTGYKCRIRRKWYVVPSVHRPDAFMLRQVHQYPRLSLNGIAATSTDTVHRVRIKTGVNPRALAAGFHNSATFLFAEAFGRSYGGGVLELEPSEADRLLLPYRSADEALFAEVDRCLRLNDTATLVDVVDRTTLGRMGYDTTTIETIRSAGARLRDRRLGRKVRARSASPWSAEDSEEFVPATA